MITLYQFATSPFTEKVRRALNYKEIAFDIHEVARAEVPQGNYQHVSKTDKFPAITDGDTAIHDSTDIIYHLEKNHPGKSIVPDDPREAALAHAIEEWADESLYFYEMTMRLSWEHNLESALDEFSQSLPSVPKAQLKKMIVESVSQLTSAQGVGRKPREQVVNDVERHLKALDAMLEAREWLAGSSLSFADLAVIAQLNALLYAQETQTLLDNTKNIKPWIERVNAAAPKE
ncbi:MAG: glutathione S-transferase family protein [Pseudomonadota bacterium]